MMKAYTISWILLGLLYTAHCKPSDVSSDYPFDEDDFVDDGLAQNDADDYYSDNNDKNNENGVPPADDNSESIVMLTTGMTFIQYEDDNITLPCKTNGSDPVLIWRKDKTIYFQSQLRVAAPSNMEALSDDSLFIKNFKKNNSGSYECFAMTNDKNRPMVVHQVIYRPNQPQINMLAAKDNITVLRVGDTLSLKCTASGKPQPHISWHKGPERFAIEGENLIIPDIKLRDAGFYRCLADNKIDKPAHAEIEIKIEHAPQVSVEKIIINSESNTDTELKCIVHAEPRASVVWRKDDRNVINSQHTQLKTEGHNHLLIIRGIQESDFGEYTCIAANSLGTTKEHLKVVKTPAVLKFIKPEEPGKDVLLTWQVQSKQKITEHEIQYRKKGTQDWESIKPEMTPPEDDVYTVKYALKGLEPGMYESRIRSLNPHGWSDFSDPTPFEGVYAKHGHKHKKGHNNKDKHVTPPENDTTKHTVVKNDAPAEHQVEDARFGAAATDNGNGQSCRSSSIAMISLAILFLCMKH